MSPNHTVVQYSTDVLQNGSLTTVAGSGHHYIALIKLKVSFVIYKAKYRIKKTHKKRFNAVRGKGTPFLK